MHGTTALRLAVVNGSAAAIARSSRGAAWSRGLPRALAHRLAATHSASPTTLPEPGARAVVPAHTVRREGGKGERVFGSTATSPFTTTMVEK